MPKSRNRKKQKTKSISRNIEVSQRKKKIEKMQREMIMNLIEQEKKKRTKGKHAKIRFSDPRFDRGTLRL